MSNLSWDGLYAHHLLHRVWQMSDSLAGHARYPYLMLCFFGRVSSLGHRGSDFAGILRSTHFLTRWVSNWPAPTILDFSLCPSPPLYPSRMKLMLRSRGAFTETSHKFFELGCLGLWVPRWVFNTKHFLQITYRLIVQLQYLQFCLLRSICFPLAQLQVCSHQLRVEIDHHLPRA